jgi:small GTP-binding protein
MSEINTYKRKIVLLGDGGVGKTSLIRRFVINKFDDKYLCTVGTKVTEKNLLVKDKQGEKMKLRLLIWDFMGQKGFRKIEKSGLRGTSGAIIVYDVSRPETMASIEEYWIPRLHEAAPDVPIMILANKIDLFSDSEKTSQETTSSANLQNMLNRNNASGYFTSALTGNNVGKAFSGMGKMLIKNLIQQSTPQLPKSIIRQVNSNYESDLIKATDEIIMDFHKNFGSDFEETMPIIRRQFEKAGVDINDPTVESLRRAIDYLGRVESNFWSYEEVSSRRKKRLSIINQIYGINESENYL